MFAAAVPVLGSRVTERLACTAALRVGGRTVAVACRDDAWRARRDDHDHIIIVGRLFEGGLLRTNKAHVQMAVAMVRSALRVKRAPSCVTAAAAWRSEDFAEGTFATGMQ